MPKQALHEAAAFRSNTDVAIHVPDLAKAEAFYADVLGFPVVNRGAEYLQFDTGAFQLYANLDDKARPFIPSFSVPDLEVAKRQLKEAGCKQVKAGPTTYYEDPFGFAFDIIAS